MTATTLRFILRKSGIDRNKCAVTPVSDGIRIVARPELAETVQGILDAAAIRYDYSPRWWTFLCAK